MKKSAFLMFGLFSIFPIFQGIAMEQEEDQYDKIISVYKKENAYELKLMGDDYIAEDDFKNASMAFLASLRLFEDNHDLKCFLKKHGFDYSAQIAIPEPNHKEEFKQYAKKLSRKLSE